MAKWPKGIRPNGNGIQIRIYRHGQEVPVQVEGDPYNARDLAAAVKKRDELVSRVKLGLPLFTGDDSKLTLFKDAAQDYMNDLEASYSTHVNYEQALNAYWIPAFGNWPVTDITARAIKKVLRRDFAVTTKRTILSPLRGVLDYAEVSPNPARGIQTGRRLQSSNEVVRYTPDERQALLGALRGQSRVYFSLLFGCGLRPGEALAATWPDYSGEYIVIRQTISKRELKTSTKTYHSRKVYVPSWLRQILNNHTTRHKKGWVFLTRFGGHYKSPEIFNDAWRAAHKKTGLPPRVAYTCRHTRAAELLSQGIEPGEAAKQMGHSLKTFIETYAEWIEEYSTARDMSRFEGVQVDTTGWQASDRLEADSEKPKVLKFKQKASES